MHLKAYKNVEFRGWSVQPVNCLSTTDTETLVHAFITSMYRTLQLDSLQESGSTITLRLF